MHLADLTCVLWQEAQLDMKILSLSWDRHDGIPERIMGTRDLSTDKGDTYDWSMRCFYNNQLTTCARIKQKWPPSFIDT